ncbi:shikimate kinase [Bacillus sp. REN3]|uniref:shikimate kinase n=1 Tax=Bacillus sp. REN3 TaxID=2802440 RepID=UPI001AEE41E5|nr:shikimate kinase [Bacillus sp. REN3]
MKAIYLIGFMGAGKTSVSKELAERLSVGCFDTDEEIIKASGKAINMIFATEGEQSFRKKETEIIQAMPSENAVIATGGGAILRETNRRAMKEKGLVVFLFAEPAEILERLREDTTRPLLQHKKREKAEALYSERLPLYRQAAHLEIDTTGKGVGEIAEEIIRRMKQ